MSGSPLLREHQLLGATFSTSAETGDLVVEGYGFEGEEDAFRSGCALLDASEALSLLVSGGDTVDGIVAASGYSCALFAARHPQVGEARLSAVLAGDGSVVGIPVLARFSEGEYLCWDPTPRSDTLDAWMGFVHSIESDGVAPYAATDVEDVSDATVPLLLWGPMSEEVLSDYLAPDDELPAVGRIASILLDGTISCVLVRPAQLPHALLLLVPEQYATILWRSLLSFNVVRPVGRRAFWQHLVYLWPHAEDLLGHDRVTIGREDLLGAGLVRPTGDFIGGRAILETE